MLTQPQPTPRADRQEHEGLADAGLGVEAHLLCHLQALEDKMTALQQEVLEKCAPLPPAPPAPLLPAPPAPLPPALLAPLPVVPPVTLPPLPPATSTPGPRPTGYFYEQTPNAAPVESPALRDISSRSNVVATSTQGGYVVPPDVVSIVLFGCKSRRNLAACLAAKIFSVQERQGSNCSGCWGRCP